MNQNLATGAKLDEEIKALMTQAKTISAEQKEMILHKLESLPYNRKLALKLNLLKTLFLESQKEVYQKWQGQDKKVANNQDLEEFSGQTLNTLVAKEDTALSEAKAKLISIQLKNA